MKSIIVLFLMIMTQTTTAGVIGQGGGGGTSRLSDFARNNFSDGVLVEGGERSISNKYKPVAFGIRGTIGGEIGHANDGFNRFLQDMDKIPYFESSVGNDWAR